MTIAEPQVHRFTRTEYRRMAETGVFANSRVELIDGEILDMSPQGESHVYVVSELGRYLVEHAPKEIYQVRCQAPLTTGAASDPEPDFAVVAAERPHKELPPDTALLVIEVADSSLSRDISKAAHYAAAGVKEYWIINTRARVIEQHTIPLAAIPAGGEPARYKMIRTFSAKETIACTALPLPPRLVESLLPPF